MNAIVKKVLAVPAVKAAVTAVYEARRDRAVNPEGEFDSAGRWYPDPVAEDWYGSFRGIRGPSRNHPYSYMVRARTKQHCQLLALAHLTGGLKLPGDCGAIRALDAADAVAASLLPKKYRSDSDGRALALAAFVAAADVYADEDADVAALAAFADWLQERGAEVLAATVRAVLPATV